VIELLYAGIDFIYIAHLYIDDVVRLYGMFQFVAIFFNEDLMSSTNKKNKKG
jgi:hypothetical protein